MINIVLICITKCAVGIINMLTLGAGSTWPGHIALKFNKNFIHDILSQNRDLKTVLVVGTNGKTTTSKLLKQVLEKNNQKVFLNPEGANLMNGIASAIIKNASLSGKIPYDIAIFEVDENTLPLALKQIKPYALLILNLFRDQLDRYGEVNSISLKWQDAMKALSSETFVFINGDDPQLYFLGEHIQANVHYFGVTDELQTIKIIPHDVDSVYCPVCGTRLEYKGISYSHLGNFRCPKGDFERKNVETFTNQKIEYPLIGTYNIYNTNAVILTAQTAFSLTLDQIQNGFKNFLPAYGRQETIEYNGRKFFMVLSKNPTGLNQSIDLVTNHFQPQEHTIIVILNDRIPDGRDISWIWDVEFNQLPPFAKHIVVTGDRVYDMALRLKYTYDKNDDYKHKLTIKESLQEAIDASVEQSDPSKEIIVLSTYSGMLETRKIIKGRKIL